LPIETSIETVNVAVDNINLFARYIPSCAQKVSNRNIYDSFEPRALENLPPDTVSYMVAFRLQEH
jgi:hypothetical protein